MSPTRIKRDLKNQMHFITFTVSNWYYLFDRHNRFEILENSFVYCQKHKGLKVFAFVFMLNHLHFIASAPGLIGVIRDMKTFLSKELQKNIIAFEPNVLKIFKKEDGYQLWKKGNAPKVIESEDFFEQKMNYIRMNPVLKQYVNCPEDWRWSSFSTLPTNIKISNIYEDE